MGIINQLITGGTTLLVGQFPAGHNRQGKHAKEHATTQKTFLLVKFLSGCKNFAAVSRLRGLALPSWVSWNCYWSSQIFSDHWLTAATSRVHFEPWTVHEMTMHPRFHSWYSCQAEHIAQNSQTVMHMPCKGDSPKHKTCTLRYTTPHYIYKRNYHYNYTTRHYTNYITLH